MADRLETIKRYMHHDPHNNSLFRVGKEGIEWLIAEVERLRSLKINHFSKWKMLVDENASLQSQLKAVEKERDKLHDYIQGRWMEGDAVHNLMKLEAQLEAVKKENKKLKWHHPINDDPAQGSGRL